MGLTPMAFGVKGGTPFISLVLRECLNLVLKLSDLNKITSSYLGEKQASVLKLKIYHPKSCVHPTGQSSSAPKKEEIQTNLKQNSNKSWCNPQPAPGGPWLARYC